MIVAKNCQPAIYEQYVNNKPPLFDSFMTRLSNAHGETVGGMSGGEI